VVTRGRKFPNSKRAGRNASEPRRSLVNELEKPTLWSEGEGRWMDAEIDRDATGRVGHRSLGLGGKIGGAASLLKRSHDKSGANLM